MNAAWVEKTRVSHSLCWPLGSLCPSCVFGRTLCHCGHCACWKCTSWDKAAAPLTEVAELYLMIHQLKPCLNVSKWLKVQSIADRVWIFRACCFGLQKAQTHVRAMRTCLTDTAFLPLAYFITDWRQIRRQHIIRFCSASGETVKDVSF